jgi:zeaxanthin glucosyltransferase
MSHFGILSYKGTGHLNSLIALGRRLVSRGHRVTFFQGSELELKVVEAGLEFCSIDAGRPSSRRPASTDHGHLRRSKSAFMDLRYRIKRITDEMERYLSQAPNVLIQAGVDALIIDELVLPGPTLSEMLKLPYFFVSTSIPHNFGWAVPKSLSRCQNQLSFAERLQNAFLQVSVFRLQGPIKWRLEQWRRRLGLGSVDGMRQHYPALAHIATLPACLDFPQPDLPANFHYTGPFVDCDARPPIDFPRDRLDERPLIFVSLGTARKISFHLFRTIADACDGLGMQVVISLGGSRDPGLLGELPGNPVIVREAPQLELIKLSKIVINHAGINTVLECLMEGKPMIVIPITHDQPAMAARLAWLEVAEVIPEKRLTSPLLRAAIKKLLANDRYRARAAHLQKTILASHGLDHAVKLLEAAMESRAAREACPPPISLPANNRNDPHGLATADGNI